MLLGALLAATVVPAAAAASPAGARVVFRPADPRIDEASGIGLGIRSPGVVYVQNDSGDAARFFALNARTGATVATITVPEAQNVDWEDLAVARDAAGTPSVWLADIGDNDADRRTVTVYRVTEPRLSATSRGLAVTSGRAAVYRLRYPDGASDAESLAVAPGGRAYIVTKSLLGTSGVYQLPARPNASRVQSLRRLGAITFPTHGSGGPFDGFGQVLATGAAIAPDGRVLVVRTYTDAYLWRVVDGDVAAALRTRPVRVALPVQRQGEGVTFDGHRLLIDSEGVGAAVWRVPVPARLFRVTRPVPHSSRTTIRSSVAPGSPARHDDVASHQHGSNGLPFLAAFGALLVVLGIVAFVVFRPRHGRSG